MENAIEELFQALHDNKGDQVISYGAVRRLSEYQLRRLVALSYIFPGRFSIALKAIDGNRCHQYCDDKRNVWSIGNYVPSLQLWSCPCTDYLTLIEQNGIGKWRRACSHLIAAYMLSNQYQFLPDIPCTEMSSANLALLVLNGPT